MAQEKYTAPVESLLEGRAPKEWIFWLFDIQNNLIAHNHLESFTEEGAKEFSSRFWELKNFFQEIDNVKPGK